MYFRFGICLSIFFGEYSSLIGQILNIDREINDSMSKKWYGLVSGSFTKDKQKLDIQDINIYTEAVYKLKRGQAITYLGQIDATISGNNILQNEGFFQCR